MAIEKILAHLEKAQEAIGEAIQTLAGISTSSVPTTSIPDAPLTPVPSHSPPSSAPPTAPEPSSANTGPSVLDQTPYNEVQQASSHNSYKKDLTMIQQYEEYGMHSFELDIHAGDPGLINWFGSDDRPENDYPVYHVTGDSASNYPFLSDGLNEIASIPNAQPITLFVDIKGDALEHESQRAEDLDNLLREQLGPKLFTPADMMDRAPEAVTLEEAIEIGGWPTMEELDGRVLVVLTGNLDDYDGSRTDASAFLAPSPDISTYNDPNGNEISTLHPDPNAIYYNMSEGNADQAAVVHDSGFVARVYGFDDLGPETLETNANHLGTDHTDPDENEWEAEGPFSIIED